MLQTTINRAAGASPWKKLGTIRLGKKEKTAAGKEYPVDLDYFVIPDAFKAALGEKPKELFVCLANPSLEGNFDTRAAIYRQNGSKACFTRDDVMAKRFQKTGMKDAQGKEAYAWMDIPCPNVSCEFRVKKQCQERGYFQFMVPACGEIGVFTLKIGSSVGITHILAALRAVEGLTVNRRNGMHGIRMKLSRQPHEFYRDIKGDGNLAKITKHIVVLELDWASLMQEDQRLLAPFLGKPLALPAPTSGVPAEDLEDEEDGEPEIPFGDPPASA